MTLTLDAVDAKAQPYTPGTVFSTLPPDTPFPGKQLDAELNSIAAVLATPAPVAEPPAFDMGPLLAVRDEVNAAAAVATRAQDAANAACNLAQGSATEAQDAVRAAQAGADAFAAAVAQQAEQAKPLPLPPAVAEPPAPDSGPDSYATIADAEKAITDAGYVRDAQRHIWVHPETGKTAKVVNNPGGQLFSQFSVQRG